MFSAALDTVLIQAENSVSILCPRLPKHGGQ